MTKPRPFGQYFLLEKIAQGGMAEIFKGLTYDFSGLKKFIVIKRILPHIASNQDFIKMLIDEAKIAVRLSHGNIAQTLDLGKVGNDYFIVMEYAEGHTLSEVFKKSLAQGQPIPIPFSTYILSEVCQGLDYVHRRKDENGKQLGIVHCDISPQNIIVSELGTVKIVDFGVARVALQLSGAEQGVLKGKFAYMSPEQLQGENVDARSDIFSTGIILWEFLTGQRLFKRKIKSETIQAAQSLKILAPSYYRPEIPKELDEIVLKALSRDPKKRFAQASDMSLELTKFTLKHFADFKPAQTHELLHNLFQNETREEHFIDEKTLFEEFNTHVETQDPSEDTQIVDPLELKFRSIFEENDIEDFNEVTGSIQIEDFDPSSNPPEPAIAPEATFIQQRKTSKNLPIYWLFLLLGLALILGLALKFGSFVL